MPNETPVGANDPMLEQWNQWKVSEEYENCVKWISKGNWDGELWAAYTAGWRAHALLPTHIATREMPLCVVHTHLDQQDEPALTFGNGCVACSLNERVELLHLLATWVPNYTDSVTALQRLMFRASRVGRAERRIKELQAVLADIADSESAPFASLEVIRAAARQVLSQTLGSGEVVPVIDGENNEVTRLTDNLAAVVLMPCNDPDHTSGTTVCRECYQKLVEQREQDYE